MAHKLLSEIVRDNPTIQKSDLNLLERLRDAHVTALEHYMIAGSVRPREGPVGDEIRRKISQSTKGAELESRDNDHSARNAQFELYVGAFLTMGDATVSLGEPDVRFVLDRTWHGVAAKRVKNDARLLERADEAAAQIAASGLDGFVALNVDRLPLTQPAPDGVAVDSTLTEALPVLRAVDDRLFGRAGVMGRFAFFRDVTWDVSGAKPRMVLGFREHFHVWMKSVEDRERLRPELDAVFQRARHRFERL
jgi:hypothetical protein